MTKTTTTKTITSKLRKEIYSALEMPGVSETVMRVQVERVSDLLESHIFRLRGELRKLEPLIEDVLMQYGVDPYLSIRSKNEYRSMLPKDIVKAISPFIACLQEIQQEVARDVPEDKETSK